MKAHSPAFPAFTALSLKVVGVILIVSSLIDYITLLIPFNVQEKAWQLTFATQIVDRGVIPLVGISFLLVGYWIGSSYSDSQGDENLFLDLKFWAFVLASILGLLFLVLPIVHMNNINQQSQEYLKQIDAGANQAQQQLAAQSQQVDALRKDPKKLAELDEAIKSGRFQGAQLQQLQELQKLTQDPKVLNERLTAAQTQLGSRKLKAENQTQTEAWKLGLRTSLSSLLLALGYIAIGWTGLRGLGGGSSPSRRKAQAR